MTETETLKSTKSTVKERSSMEVIKLVIASKGADDPFYVADLADVVSKYRSWRAKLPRVRPFYAVKCNPDPVVLDLLMSFGAGFDCASKVEIDTLLSMGCDPSSIVFGHPCKARDLLRHASQVGVDLMTFDSPAELYKIKDSFSTAKLVIRFCVPNVKAEILLNDKFGCQLSECGSLLRTAKMLGLNVVGTCFHVGSLCSESDAYFRAIGMAREVFDIAKDIGFDFTLLDIGGGFPGHSESYELFTRMCHQINKGLDLCFPATDKLQIIAEPGCYFVCSAFTLCCKIIGRREINNKENGSIGKKIEYYLNDSTYGSFAVGIEKYNYRIKPLFNSGISEDRILLPSKLWGRTACSLDLIKSSCHLPLMEVEESLAFENMGAYSIALSSNFNGFPIPSVMYTYSAAMDSQVSSILGKILAHQCTLLTHQYSSANSHQCLSGL